MISEYRRTLRLKAEHVDCFRALRLSVLMRLFQECCIAHTEELGMGREKTLDRGFLWIVNAEMIRVRRMPEYDEEITLVCRPGRTLHYFFPRQMSVLDRDGMEIILIGAVWSLIDEKTRQLIDPAENGIFINGEDRPEDIRPPLSLPNPELTDTVSGLKAAYSLVDINGHVNNTHCADMALDLIGIEKLRDLSVRTVKCVFRKEIPAGAVFDLNWGQTGAFYSFRNEYFALDLEFAREKH